MGAVLYCVLMGERGGSDSASSAARIVAAMEANDADQVTRSFRVCRGLEADVRERLRSLVRLSFTEKSRWWRPSTLFTLTGPRWAVDQAIAEAKRAEADALADMRVW